MKKDKAKFSSIIFDFDGVISNTDKGRFIMLTDMLKKYSINLEEKHNPKELTGVTTDSFLSDNFKQFTKDEIKQIARQRREHYINNLDKYCVPFEGAIDTLKKYSAITDIYLATTNDRKVVNSLLKHLDIEDIFVKTFSRNELETDGCKLKNYSYVLSQINRGSDECIVVEDSPVGVESAKKAGICTIKFGDAPLNGAIKPDYEAKDYEQLNEILDEVGGRFQ